MWPRERSMNHKAIPCRRAAKPGRRRITLCSSAIAITPNRRRTFGPASASPQSLGECGYDHTWYEPGTPGYLAMHHNALWAGLAKDFSASPLWWSNGPMTGDSVLTRSLLYFSQFLRGIAFGENHWRPAALKVSSGDGWAMAGERMTFGWVGNLAGGVLAVTMPELKTDRGHAQQMGDDVAFKIVKRGVGLQ